jgi:Cu+-exporting ATPase
MNITTSDTCPVCGMAIEDPAAAPTSTHDGVTYRFCCEACKQQFDADPEKFVGA